MWCAWDMAELCADALALARKGHPWEWPGIHRESPSWAAESLGGIWSQGNGVKDGSFRVLILQALLSCMLQSRGHVGVSLAAVVHSQFLFFPTACKSPDFPPE